MLRYLKKIWPGFGAIPVILAIQLKPPAISQEDNMIYY